MLSGFSTLLEHLLQSLTAPGTLTHRYQMTFPSPLRNPRSVELSAVPSSSTPASRRPESANIFIQTNVPSFPCIVRPLTLPPSFRPFPSAGCRSKRFSFGDVSEGDEHASGISSRVTPHTGVSDSATLLARDELHKVKERLSELIGRAPLN